MDVSKFGALLRTRGVDFFAGVPDSLLKDFGNYLYDHMDDAHHVIAANEGNAVGLAAGSYVATGKIPLVYLQNSGLGNTVNPLLSMADQSLYAIPMIILVGWRGQPGTKDAEQHLKQGPTTLSLIEAMDYPQVVLGKDEATVSKQIEEAFDMLSKEPRPYFFVVEKGTFEKYQLTQKPPSAGPMGREEALRVIAESLPEDNFVVTTTGKTSREWFEVREQLGQSHAKDFLTVGSMGHTSSIAMGMALSSNKNIVCIDGDGSLLMHLGASVLMGKAKLSNLRYILVNNFSHESVGGLPTPMEHIDYERFFKSIGFDTYYKASDEEELRNSIGEFMASTHAVLEIRVKQGSRDDLARPDTPAGDLVKILRKEFDK